MLSIKPCLLSLACCCCCCDFPISPLMGASTGLTKQLAG